MPGESVHTMPWETIGFLYFCGLTALGGALMEGDGEFTRHAHTVLWSRGLGIVCSASACELQAATDRSLRAQYTSGTPPDEVELI